MKNLVAAQEELEKARKELERYSTAKSKAIADFVRKRQLFMQTRDQLKDAAVEFYLGEGITLRLT